MTANFFVECSKVCYKLDPYETFPEVGGCPCYSASDKAVINKIINKIMKITFKDDHYNDITFPNLGLNRATNIIEMLGEDNIAEIIIKPKKELIVHEIHAESSDQSAE